jgi:hypothetical protein
MSFDFSPDLSFPQEPNKKEKKTAPAKTEIVNAGAENSLVAGNVATSDVVTMNNLLGLTQSHINDDNECRAAVSRLTQELNDSIHLMSIKDLIDYLKVKIREREFHVDCIFKAYAFIQKSEFAREMLVGSTRKERIIEVSDRKRITGLLNMLNNTD